MKSSSLILIIIVTILLMMFAGWLTFEAYSGGASVTIDTNEMKKDTEKAIEKGEELIEKAKEKGDKLIKHQDNEEEPEAVDESDADNATNSEQETENPVLTE